MNTTCCYWFIMITLVIMDAWEQNYIVCTILLYFWKYAHMQTPIINDMGHKANKINKL
jgi:hypothetical protein